MKTLTSFTLILLLFISCQSNDKKNEETLNTSETTKTNFVSSSSFKFKTPALQVDFPNDAIKQEALNQDWHTNLSGFTNQGIAGNSWNSSNDTNITNYFNPAIFGIPAGSQNLPIEWSAFPGRIAYYYPTLSSENANAMADTGLLVDGSMPEQIPKNGCDPSDTDKINYGPYGPRGFQDEYCEWAVRRDASGKIIRIDFTCENPEYWNSLWNVDPSKVVSLYQETLDLPNISMQDLVVTDANGSPVIDPSTGNSLYNPLNKYNTGNNGAMHLTSTPNTIQTEIGLATSASLGRQNYGSGDEALLCCGQFGQKFRNSDPSIGANVNKLTGQGYSVSLANPPGLYIQKPGPADFAQITTPDGKDPSTFWTTVRGQEQLPDVDGLKMPGNYILHAKFEVPDNLGYDVGDLKINGKNVDWGSQIAKFIKMHIIATGYKTKATQAYDCVGTPAEVYAQPLQLFHKSVFDGYKNVNVKNPAKFSMTLLSNSTYITPKIKKGVNNVQMVLVVNGISLINGNPTVSFTDSGITATVVTTGIVSYAIPGNSYPGNYQTVTINVNTTPNLATGVQGVYITNAGQDQSQPMKALLEIL